MATDMKRFTISIPADIEEETNRIKQSTFYNKTQSEMFRYLIRLGIEVVGKQPKEKM